MRNAIKLRVMGFAALTATASGCNGEAAPESFKADHAVVEIRQRADPARGRIWVLTRSGVLVIDATSSRSIRRLPLPGWVWAGEPYGCPPDLALGPNGEAVVSSDVAATLWRVDPETFEVSEHALALESDTAKDIGFSELEYSRDQNAYLGVSTFDGSVWRIDPLLARAQKVSQLAPPVRVCRSGARPSRGLTPGYAVR